MQATILTHLQDRNYAEAKALMQQSDPWEIARLLGDLPATDRGILFRLLDKNNAIAAFEALSDEQQRDLLSAMSRTEAVRILEELEADDRARLLDELPAKVAKRLINELTPVSRETVLRLLNYPDGSIGRFISPQYVAVRENATAAEALDAVRASHLDGEHLGAVFVVDQTRHYRGLLNVGELVKADSGTPVTQLMKDADVCVHATDDAEAAARLLQRRNLWALPVVDAENRLVGAVTVDDAMEVLDRETSEAMYRRAGMGDVVHAREAIRSERLIRGGILYPVRVRLAFLMMTLAGGLAVGGLIEQFEDTLAAVVVLAVFIPLVMDMGGNVGTQSTTIFARGLALGHVNLRAMPRHVIREVGVGITMGLLVGTVAGVIAYFWQGAPNDVPELGLAVGIALFSTITLASFLGFAVPWLMLKLGLDHAPGADPFITTIKDFSGLFIYFALAAWVLDIA
jgi:magnesium transporter